MSSGTPPDADEAAMRDAERSLADRRDRLVVERVLAGEVAAFNELVARYQDHVFAVAFRIVGEREAAADAAQEAFLAAYRNLARLRGDSFRGWLTRIAMNAATDVHRHRKRRPSEPYPEWEDEAWQPAAGPEDNPEVRAVAAGRDRLLAAALGRIGPDQRTAILLFDVEGYDYAEIATMTGVSLGTVKSRIHRGRLALRDLLAEHVDLMRA